MWRARIGSHFHGSEAASSLLRASSCDGSLASGTLSRLSSFFFRILLILLVCGNVERNPGPGLEKCRVCNFEARTVGEHMQHQRLHESGFNFRYVCPVIPCHFTFTSYATFDSHVSSHSVPRNEVACNAETSRGGLLCDSCGEVQACVKNLCDHMIREHLQKGQPVHCPLQSQCAVTRPFKTTTQLRPHLSTYHPGWTKDFGRYSHHLTNFLLLIYFVCSYHFI